MAYQGHKTLKELLPPGHPFLQPRIIFGMKPPPNDCKPPAIRCDSEAKSQPLIPFS